MSRMGGKGLAIINTTMSAMRARPGCTLLIICSDKAAPAYKSRLEREGLTFDQDLGTHENGSKVRIHQVTNENVR